MEHTIFKNAPDALPSQTTTPKRSKTMSAAALAANRANALKSTGPRTPQGKIIAASNALKHGIYSLTNFDHFIHDSQIAFEVVQNLLAQFDAVTPTEVALLHQLIHHQLRFLQMEFLFGQAMNSRIHDILASPAPFLTTIIQELHRLPTRIERTTNLLRKEIAARHALLADQPDLPIEAIPDAPPLPEPLAPHLPDQAPPLPSPTKLGIEAKPVNPETGLPADFDAAHAPLSERLFYLYQYYLNLRRRAAQGPLEEPLNPIEDSPSPEPLSQPGND